MTAFLINAFFEMFAGARVQTPPASMPMPSPIPDQLPSGPHDIEEILPYVIPWWQIALVVAGILGLAAIIAGIWYWYKNKKAVPEITIVDHWAELSEKIQHLKPDEALAQGQAKEFYFQLSLLLRSAIELATEVRATDMTFRELAPFLDKKLPVSGEELHAIKEFLTIADMVKFADRPATEGEAVHFKQCLMRWVSSFKPRQVIGLPTDLRQQSLKGGAL